MVLEPKQPLRLCPSATLRSPHARSNPVSWARLGEEDTKLGEEAAEEEALGPWQPAKNQLYCPFLVKCHMGYRRVFGTAC